MLKFWEFYRIVKRRRWMVLGIMAVTLTAIYVSTMDDRPHYRASVQVMPSDTALYRPILPSPGSSVEAALGGRQTGSQMPNLMSLIKSRKVAERTIRIADLQESPDSLMARTSVSTAQNPGARSRQELGTEIIEITVRDLDPTRAVRTVNSLAHVFASFYQDISHQEAAENRKFLETELVRAKDDLESASDRLKAFKRSHRITTVEDASTGPMGDLRRATAERDAARAALAEVQAKLNEVDRQLARMQPTRTVEEATSNTPMINELEAQHAQLTRQLNDARAKYEDIHPQVIGISESLEQVKAKLEEERGKMRTTVSVIRNPVYESLLAERSKLAYERDGLAARAGQMDSSVGRASGDLKLGDDVTLARLQTEFDTSQGYYVELQSKLNQARINEKETMSAAAIRVIDEAQHAVGPIGINRIGYLLLGAMLSLMVGTGLAITMESLDNRLKGNRDVERLLGLPVTTLIPKSLSSSDSGLARIVHTDPLSPIAEAYRFLRTDLLLSTEAIGAKTVMVATAKPGQGGTSTVANLGISLAMDGKRVVIVDADMRRPSLHRIFKVSNDFGLCNVLTNEKDLEEVIFGTEIENLLFVPAGSTPSNPSELLGSARMQTLVGKLAEHADYVLFDTPSAVAFTDAVVLSRLVDGVVLVVRAQQVPRGAELQVRDLLNKADATILGVVLNDVKPEMVDSYYYHSHYYPNLMDKKRLESAEEVRSLPPSA